MTEAPTTALTLDAGPVRFEVRIGMRRVACNVSDEALEAASGLATPSTATLRRKSFDRFRILIDAAARLKLGTLPSDFIGPVVLSSGDLRRVPPQAGSPVLGCAGRGT